MSYVRVIRSGDYVELYTYEKDYVHKRKRNNRKRKRQQTGYYQGDNTVSLRSSRSIKRARENFFRLVLSNVQGTEKPTILTLTNYEQHVEIAVAYEYIKKFWQNVKKQYEPELKYIGVPEWQKRGSIHFHFLVWGIQPETVFNEVPSTYRRLLRKAPLGRYMEFCRTHGFMPGNEGGTRNLQRCWSRGYLDVSPTDGQALRIAGYMAKYLTKALTDRRLRNRRAYTCSRNINRPTTYGVNEVDDSFRDYYLGVDNEPIKQFDYDTMYFGRCVYTLN